MKIRLEFVDAATGCAANPEYTCYPGNSMSPVNTCIIQAKADAFNEGYCLDLDEVLTIFVNDVEQK